MMSKEKVIFHSKTVLLDIEGTITSIAFVKDILFPYARTHLRDFIYNTLDLKSHSEIIALIKKQYQEDLQNNYEGLVPIEEGDGEKDSIIKNLLWQMDLDRKTHALKKVQGYIWREGYACGELKGHIYDDVVPVLKQWVESGFKLYIFSSASVDAQLVHLGYSTEGDLLELFTAHFDASIGAKIEALSYHKIAENIGKDPAEILFITDVVREAEAAIEAGFEVIISIRPGNVPIDECYRSKFKFIESFDQLCHST